MPDITRTGTSDQFQKHEQCFHIAIQNRQNGRIRKDWPIEDYAALGDGRSVSLIAPDGTVAWWCVPSLDSPALFDCLLDREAGGYFQISPDTDCRIERAYRHNSNVMETLCTSASGVVRLTQSLYALPNRSTAPWPAGCRGASWPVAWNVWPGR
ncbi:trehalase-like domain-containing protein [Gluconacetobacter takamatsuzukensis]|uniref:trehalase-like domain-containing protein n=1 Tax=Gluconacetobacter takamatsuzukensis TaxID=1286190 RepID=UPI001C8249DE|nr:trehalase-like domain-containing protein [Gluconacetobacter takamatsuzukensis]